MSHPAVTLKKSSDGIAYSAFPLGNKPAGALSYYNITNPGVTPVNGDLVAICTDTYDFGTVGPKLVHRLILSGATVGDVSDITTIWKTSNYMSSLIQKNPNAATSDGKFKVQADATAPYGKSIAVGQPSYSDTTLNSASIKTTSKTQDTETFTHAVYYFPAANQANFLSYAQTSADNGWGQKFNWHTYQTGSSTSMQDIDVYFSLFRNTGNQPSVIFTKEELCQSNDSLTLHLQTSNTQCALNPADATKFRAVPCIQQHYIKIASSGKVEAKLIDTSSGCVYGFNENSISQNTAVASQNNTFDTYYINTQSNGYPIDVGANYLCQELVTFCGPGATCRVTITDVPGAGVSGVAQKAETVNDPSYWSSRVAIVKIVEGMFAGRSLAGKYFNVWKSGNTYVASTGAIA